MSSVGTHKIVDASPIVAIPMPPKGPHDQILSRTKNKEIIMTDQADAERITRQTPSSDTADLQFISKDEFTTPNHKLIKKPRTKNKRMAKQTTKQKSRIEEPRTKGRKVPQELATVQRELKLSQDVLRKEQSRLQEVRKKLAASQGELTACKDDLFRLQPVAPVPDSRVAKESKELCQQIVNWVDAKAAAFERAHPEYEPEHIFLIGEDNEAAQFMKRYPEAGEHLAAFMIHRWLQENLFRLDVPHLGLSAEAVRLLERTEQSMASLDPPRESTTIASWRSETLKAIASTNESKEIKERQSQDMNRNLFRDLARTLPILFCRQETHISFHTHVLVPAVKLASLIQESTSRYSWSFEASLLSKRGPFRKADLKKVNVIDMKTSKCLKTDSPVVASRRGDIG